MVDHTLVGDLPSSGPVRNDAGTDRARDCTAAPIAGAMIAAIPSLMLMSTDPRASPSPTGKIQRIEDARLA
ncbi:hypothetical protein ACFWN5_41075 [Streptomyces sp. NPDC058430]|uniref:hypothetical protein n=1 Tax=Streptomyces sp. NPDC058430 TaxID=3346495 RepID=UPI003659FF3A